MNDRQTGNAGGVRAGMKIAVIADDLTGATDTGVQLGTATIHLSERMLQQDAQDGADVHVFDTDSRYMDARSAYDAVYRLSQAIAGKHCDVVYKKIDSTLRGNAGAEIDAVYDVFAPDFMVIAPAFPDNGRTLVEGILYVNGRPLGETEWSQNPDNPTAASLLPALLALQTERQLAGISLEAVRDEAVLSDRLERHYRERIPYVWFDAETTHDLERISRFIHASGYRVVWVGSAGLARVVVPPKPRATAPVLTGSGPPVPVSLPVPVPVLFPVPLPVLLVVGSISGASRTQLQEVLLRTDTAAVEVDVRALAGEAAGRTEELRRVRRLLGALAADGRHIAVYSSYDGQRAAAPAEAGQRYGGEHAAVGSLISDALGEIAADAVTRYRFRRLVLTGGDTARRVLQRLGCETVRVLEEIEPGIPLVRLHDAGDAGDVYAVTKAGGFGSRHTLSRAIDRLKGGG